MRNGDFLTFFPYRARPHSFQPRSETISSAPDAPGAWNVACLKWIARGLCTPDVFRNMVINLKSGERDSLKCGTPLTQDEFIKEEGHRYHNI